MKTLLLYTFFLFSKSCVSQNNPDTLIKYRVLDSLEQLIYKLKDSNFRLNYENYVFHNVANIDTVTKKDSSTINYKSDKGILLKSEIKKLRADGCIYYRSVCYFNKTQLPEFIEYYEQSCLTKEELEGNDTIFEKLLYWYERYEYDSKNRITVRIGWFPTVKARRFEYSYDSDGKSTIKFVPIKEEYFWD